MPALLAERTARGDHPLLICDDDVLTYADAAARSAALAKGLLAAGVGKGTHVGLLHPNGSAFVVGWLAATRIGAVALPLSTFSTSAELRTLLRNADIEVLLAARSVRGRDIVRELQEAVPGFDPGEPAPLFLACGTRAPAGALRHRRSRRDGPRGRRRGAHGHGGSGLTGRPHGDRPHLGLDQRAEGRDPPARPADPPPRQPEPAAAVPRGRGAVLELAVLLDRWVRLQPARDAARRSDPRLLERRRSRGHPRPARAGAPDDGERVRRGGGPPGEGPVVRRSRPLVDPAGQPLADHARRRASGGPRAAPQHARHDRGRQRLPGQRGRGRSARAPAGIVRATGAGVRGEGRRSGDRRRVRAGEVGELWLRGPFLMEGYYGRERHETFTPTAGTGPATCSTSTTTGSSTSPGAAAT